MKLAEALQERADLNSRIYQLRQRIEENLKVQEGDEPDMDVNELMKEHDDVVNQLTTLVTKINLTNCSVKDNEGRTITELLSKRDSLKLMLSTYQGIIESSGSRNHRISRPEIKLLSTIKVADVKTKLDAISKQFRLIDSSIQQLNWQVDLIE